jgi:outer membrane protein OmpA-like peptidoglycan-associated protein
MAYRARHPLAALTAVAAASIALISFTPRDACAQSKGFAVDRFEPSERGSDWFSNESLDLRGSGRFAFGVVGDYGHKPVVIYNGDGSERAALVEHQLFLHVGASVNLFERVRLGVNMPFALLQDGASTTLQGASFAAPSGDLAVGDLRAALDVRLFGKFNDPITVAIGGQLWMPTGDENEYTGDGSARLGPRLLAAGDLGPFAYAARLGYVYRASGGNLAGYPIRSEFTFGAAAGFRFADHKLLLGPELSGSTVVEGSNDPLRPDPDVFSRKVTPVELLFGVHYTESPIRFGLGAGPGLSRGVGEPDFRVVGNLEIFPGIEEKKPEPKPEPKPQPKPEPPPPPPPVVVPPPPPPPDRDQDGVLDADDACPDEAGKPDTDPTRNGCPDKDNDGILDKEDACPDQPGPKDPDPKKNGCPSARIEAGQIKILDQVKFKTGSAQILPESDGILNAVQKILTDHPEITKLGIEGHTDSRGAKAMNVKLSKDRAAAVMKWLVDHGIAKDRLSSAGFGPDRPLDSNETEIGRQNNRRVEFHIQSGTPAVPIKTTP